MADELKRVGLRLTAEGADDFQRTLKDASNAAKENYNQFKLAQSQWDKNTSSAQKLGDRQKYLQGQTEIYGDKVSILKRQLEEMEKSENADKDAIEKKKNEIAKAQTALNNYKSALEDVTSQIETHSAALQEWGNNLQTAGDKISGLGNVMTAGITAPVAAIGAASVAAFSEVDAALDTVTVKTGASGDALEDMQDRVKNIAESIPTDFQTAADAVGEVNTRFGLTGDALEDLSTQFVQFAELNDTDVSSSVDGVQKALTAFGLSSDDAGHMLDTFNKIGQNTGISMDTLSGDMVKYASSLQEMGLSADESAAFLGQCEMSGADLAVVMGGMQKALKSATDEGITMDEQLGIFSKTMSSNKSDTEKLNTAYEIFGSKAGAAIYEMCKNGTMDFDSLASAAADSAGSVANTFSETLDPIDQFTLVMNNLKDLGTQIVDAAGPMITDVLTLIKDGVVTLKEKWEGLSPSMQEAIEKFALIAAAVGPVIGIVGKVVSGVGGFASALGAATASAGSLSGGIISLAGGPLTIIIGAIAAVVAVLVGLYNTNEDVRNFINDAWANIKDSVGSAIEAIKGFWETQLRPAFEAIGSFLTDQVWPIVQEIFGSMGELAGQAFGAIQDAWTGTLQPALQALGDFLINTVWPFVQQVFGDMAPLVLGVFTGIQQAWETTLKPALQAFGDFLSTYVWPLVQTALSAIGAAGQAAFQFIVDAWNNVLYPALQALGNFVSTILWPAIQVAFQLIQEAVQVAFNLITGAWNNILLPVFTAIQGFVTGVLQPIFQTVFDAISAKVSEVFTAIQGFWNGTLKPVFDAIKSFIEGTLKPAFDTAFGAISSKVSEVFSAIQGFWNATLKPVFDSIKEGVSDVYGKVSEKLNNVKSKFSEVFDSVKSKVSGVVDWLKGCFNFNWSLPQIKTPHFKISGGLSLMPPSVPHVSVEWYDKAVNQPYLFSDPTIFGMSEGTAKIAGETKGEMLYGHDSLMSDIRTAIGSQNQELAQYLQQLVALNAQYLPELAGMQLVLDTGEMVGGLAPAMDKQFGLLMARKSRNN